MTATKSGANVYAGTLFQTTGPTFNMMPFNPASVAHVAVGTATFTFADGNNATFAYTVNGVSQAKAITREVFVAPTYRRFTATKVRLSPGDAIRLTARQGGGALSRGRFFGVCG